VDSTGGLASLAPPSGGSSVESTPRGTVSSPRKPQTDEQRARAAERQKRCRERRAAYVYPGSPTTLPTATLLTELARLIDRIDALVSVTERYAERDRKRDRKRDKSVTESVTESVTKRDRKRDVTPCHAEGGEGGGGLPLDSPALLLKTAHSSSETADVVVTNARASVTESVTERDRKRDTNGVTERDVTRDGKGVTRALVDIEKPRALPYNGYAHKCSHEGPAIQDPAGSAKDFSDLMKETER
jgi:hypothetical protein